LVREGKDVEEEEEGRGRGRLLNEKEEAYRIRFVFLNYRRVELGFLSDYGERLQG
jgi:hypothetical protein